MIVTILYNPNHYRISLDEYELLDPNLSLEDALERARQEFSLCVWHQRKQLINSVRRCKNGNQD